MRIVNLMENTEGVNKCLYEHGLSFYIETNDHKILVDTGASDQFISNAKKLGVDLSLVDMLVLSHGHYDHSGGIMAFAQLNSTAIIYMQETAGGEYYHKNDAIEKYIGIDKAILQLPQVKLLKGDRKLDDGLYIFSGVTGRRLWPTGNLELMEKQDQGFVQDEFYHEQYLVIEEEGEYILVSGCAHNGILNILEHFKSIYKVAPSKVLSGFHLMKKTGYDCKDIQIIKDIATELSGMDTVFYTGHCTGEEPFDIMKDIMGHKLIYVHSGDILDD